MTDTDVKPLSDERLHQLLSDTRGNRGLQRGIVERHRDAQRRHRPRGTAYTVKSIEEILRDLGFGGVASA